MSTHPVTRDEGGEQPPPQPTDREQIMDLLAQYPMQTRQQIWAQARAETPLNQMPDFFGVWSVTQSLKIQEAQGVSAAKK